MSEYVYGTDGHQGHWLTGEEIVRCRDCEYWSESTGDGDDPDASWCDHWECEYVEPDGFCAWGIRKEQNGL